MGSPLPKRIASRRVYRQRDDAIASPAPPAERRVSGPAAPLDEDQRAENYLLQTGRRELTPRQRRRVQHKRNHASAPFGEPES